MSERRINLEEILRNKIGYLGSEPNLSKLVKERATSYDIISAMKEACRQTIELCAENATAKIITEWSGNTGSEYCDEYAVVNKQSILNTINQIE